MPATGPFLFRDGRTLPALLLIGGLGLVVYYGWQWHRAPTYNEAEIAQSTELNLALDLARMGPQLRPQGEQLEKLRAIVRAEVAADLQRDLHTAQQGLAVGLVAMVFGASSMVFVSLSRRGSK